MKISNKPIGVIKTVGHWHEKKKDNWNRRENPKINLYIYGQLIFYKRDSKSQWRNTSLFSKWCWENCIFICKIMSGPLLLNHS